MIDIQWEKTLAEKMPFIECRCEHPNTIHAGGIGDCAFPRCKCGEFKERMTPVEAPTAYQQVKQEMEF